jgi:hypothetical protein
MQTFWQPAPDAPRALDERASEELLWMKNDPVKNHRFRFLVGDGDLSGEARWGRTPARLLVTERRQVCPRQSTPLATESLQIAKRLRKRWQIFPHIT